VQGHLVPSTSIPLSTLETRFSQLPPKNNKIPFLLIADTGALFNGQRVDELLRERGWRVGRVFELSADQKAERLWEYAREKGIFGTLQDGAQLLFKPSPVLETWIDRIEDDLAACSSSAVLDIGCGSGRDLGFLVSRGHRWNVTGLDNWKNAVIRAKGMITSIDENKLDEFILARVDDAGDIISFGTTFNDSALNHKFSLVLVIRYFPRMLFRRVHEYVKIGGYLLFSHFTDPCPGEEDYHSPPPDGRVRPGEVEELMLDGSGGWEIIETSYSRSEDARPMWNVVARWTG
jgi:SAM-dependent methyltransferase